MKNKVIIRLEQALRLWEDLCFLTGLVFKSQPLDSLDPKLVSEGKLKGPLSHFSEFRKHLIDDGMKANYDYERFTGSFDIEARVLMNVGTLPMDLYSWNYHSRRIFNLTSDLQTLFGETTLEGLTWQDIKWPFNSFMLALEDPIVNGKGNQFDCILVSEVGSVVRGWEKMEHFNFLLLSKELENYRLIDRKQIEKQARKGKINSKKMIRKIEHMGTFFIDSFFVNRRFHNGELNTEQVAKPCIEGFKEFAKFASEEMKYKLNGDFGKEDEFDNFSICDKAQHLVLNTCLFLETLRPKKLIESNELEVRRWLKNIPDPDAVTDEANIFVIARESVLSRESQETASEIKSNKLCRGKPTQWIKGHWRRVWGSGDNLNAPKIWIQPYLINKHRLPPNSLPSCSKMTLK